jgi:hypothetical protein
MPDHLADRLRGEDSGRRWARDQAGQSELDGLLDMYRQQRLGPAGPGMMRGERCLKIAAVIDPTDADTWPTLEWLKEEDEFWRAGFVQGALEVHEGHDG